MPNTCVPSIFCTAGLMQPSAKTLILSTLNTSLHRQPRETPLLLIPQRKLAFGRGLMRNALQNSFWSVTWQRLKPKRIERDVKPEYFCLDRPSTIKDVLRCCLLEQIGGITACCFVKPCVSHPEVGLLLFALFDIFTLVCVDCMWNMCHSLWYVGGRLVERERYTTGGQRRMLWHRTAHVTAYLQ